MKIKFLVLLIILLTNSNLKSQNNDFQAASYNVGLGALFGVVGSVINKKSTLAFKTLMLFVGVCELFFMALLFMMLLFDTTKLQ